MKKLSILIGLFLVLAMVPMVSAVDNVGEFINESFLIISDVDVKVCNDRCKTDKDMSDGDKIGEEAVPGGTVEFDIEITNIFPENHDEVEIEDIEITITIEDIDDGDEIEEEDEFDDLKAGDDDSVKIQFDIPLEVDEDDFTVIIDCGLRPDA